MRTARLANALSGSLALTLIMACAAAPPGGGPRTAPQLTAADFRDTNEPIEVIIQRKVPGLTLTRNSTGEVVLRIRGRTALGEADDSQPLYVIDGMPGRGNSNPLSAISPDNIESITVLKGPDAAIYGTDALNGAIVIVTKKGGRRSP